MPSAFAWVFSSIMHISHILEAHRPCFSFEFFPPKTEDASKELFQTLSELIDLNPGYASVTYGAGGGTRQLTHDLVVKAQQQSGLTMVSHLTTVGHTQDEVAAILDRYAQNGILNILALRGDPPKGSSDFVATPNGFGYASELVAFIKKRHPQMGIGVAGFPEGHPACPNRMKEIEYLKAKVDAGADYICSQLFFDNHDFLDFCERCELEGIRVPIIAGIMPLLSRKSVERISELALGARIPAPLLKAIRNASDDEHAKSIGIEWATRQVQELLQHQVRGIHFYTLNKSDATRRIYQSLGMIPS
jgi:methylenetetrahydrofolate reductase (NADPH)